MPTRVLPRLLAGVLLAACALLRPTPAAAQGEGTLRVIVTDSATGGALPAATVAVGRVRGQTNPRGETVLRVPAGPGTVEVRRIGYRTAQLPVALPAGGADSLRVALSIDAIVLQRLRVTAEQLPRNLQLRDFYIRKATWGSGYFLTRQDFERNRSAPFSDAMRRVPGSYIHTDSERGTILRFNKSTPSIVDQDCPPTFYLDGQLYRVGEDLNAEFQAVEIEGVEVYTGARIPPQFNGANARCGVVVVWTKER